MIRKTRFLGIDKELMYKHPIQLVSQLLELLKKKQELMRIAAM